jgi:hypothetical protein
VAQKQCFGLAFRCGVGGILMLATTMEVTFVLPSSNYCFWNRYLIPAEEMLPEFYVLFIYLF